MELEHIIFVSVFTIVLFSILIFIIKFLNKKFNNDMDKVKKYIKDGKHSLAIEKLRHILSKKKSSDKDRAKMHYYIAESYFKMKDYSFAIVEYKHALNDGYNSPNLILSLGRCLSIIGKKEEALSQFLTLLKLDTKYKAIVSMEIAKIYYDNNQYETALVFIENVLDEDNTDKVALKYKAFCYVYLENYNDAISIMESILRKIPNDAELNYNLGLAYKAKKDYKNAIKYYKISSKDKAYAVKSLYDIGLCYVDMDNMELAIVALNTALEGNSPDKSLKLAILYKLAECYDKIQNINKAIEILENIVIIDSDYKDVNKKLNDYKEAKYSDGIKKFFKLDENEFANLALKVVSCMNLIPYSLKTTDKKYLIIFAKDGNGVHSNKKIVFFRMSYNPIFNEELVQLYDYALGYNIVNSVLITCAMASPDAIRYATISRIDIVGIKKLEGLVEKASHISLPVGITRSEEKLDWI